jgi:hypothetical protein
MDLSLPPREPPLPTEPPLELLPFRPASAALFCARVAAKREQWMRALFAANVAAAGGAGLLVLAAPERARRVLFGGARQDPMTLGVTGSVWLALGLLSAFALRNPRPFAGVLAVQALSTSAWLLSALPRLLRAGERKQLPTAGLFALWDAAALTVLPWRELFGRRPPAPPGPVCPGRG